MPGDRLERALFTVLAHEDNGPALAPYRQEEPQAPHAIERRAREERVVAPEGERRADVERVEEEVAVREDDALARAGGPRAEREDREVVEAHRAIDRGVRRLRQGGLVRRWLVRVVGHLEHARRGHGSANALDLRAEAGPRDEDRGLRALEHPRDRLVFEAGMHRHPDRAEQPAGEERLERGRVVVPEIRDAVAQADAARRERVSDAHHTRRELSVAPPLRAENERGALGVHPRAPHDPRSDPDVARHARPP